MDLGETVPSVCSETGVTDSADGREVSDINTEEVLQTQEDEKDRLAVTLPAVKAADKVCYVCNILVLTVVQACTVASALWQCVVWCFRCHLIVKTEVECSFENKHNNL
jgi:hypothetical protein